MSYTREQRAANAAKAATAASEQLEASPQLNENIEPAPERDPSVRLEPRNNPRNDVMKELLESREVEPPKVDEVADPVPPTAEQILAANTPVETPAVVEPVVAPVIEMVKVKIDGVESEVPKSEVDEEGGISAYQKSKAADNRLAKINQTLVETRQTQAAIAQWIQQNQKPAEPVITDDQFITSKMDVIRFGTPEESAAAMREVMARANPRVDSNAITQQVMTHVSKVGAAKTFKTEFSDIVNNPVLFDTAIMLENKLGPVAAQNPNTDWDGFYRGIGNQIRSAFGRQSQPTVSAVTPATPATGNPSTVSDKEARKSSIVNLPTASARAALPTESKPETREDTLNQMRKARGIPTA